MSKVNSTSTIRNKIKIADMAAMPNDFVSTTPKMMKTGSGMQLIMPLTLKSSSNNNITSHLNKNKK